MTKAHQVVLHGGSRENDSVGGSQLLAVDGDSCVRISNLVAFIEHSIIPINWNERI